MMLEAIDEVEPLPKQPLRGSPRGEVLAEAFDVSLGSPLRIRLIPAFALLDSCWKGLVLVAFSGRAESPRDRSRTDDDETLDLG